MQAVVGQEAPFDHGRQQLKLLADLEVTTKAVEPTAEAIGESIAAGEQQEIQRAMQLDLPIIVGEPIPTLYVQMDGTGVPVVKKETVGRKGKMDGQPAHTREVKLGCVFTQTRWDQEGYAIRDTDSTTYTGAIETAAEFGKRIYLEAWKRGWSRAEKKVVMGDGAEWIWNLADQHFPGAVQIVDLYHAPAPVGVGAQATSQRSSDPESLDEAPPKAPARQGQNRKARGHASVHCFHQSRSVGEDSHGSGLLREQCPTHVLPQVPPSAPVCRLGRDRGGLQERDRFPSQTIRHVLDREGSQRHHRPAVLPPQRSV